MRLGDISYLEETLKSFMNKNRNSSNIKILTVMVIKNTLSIQFFDKKQFMKDSTTHKKLNGKSIERLTVVIHIIITGICYPP